jgi:hypothetical protein
LIIRAHKRFAVCRGARLCKPGKRAVDGLLIELSLDGCRISNLGADSFAVDQLVTLRVQGAPAIDSRVRWVREGTIGLRFVQPLRAAGLDRLIRVCRGETDTTAVPLRAFGT